MARVGAIVVVFVFIGLAVLAGRIASAKGRPFWLYLIAGLLIGPVALIAALIVPRHKRVA